MMPGTPDVSVGVPLHNERANVRTLVGAGRQALRSSGPWELLWVDDGSTDGTARIVAELSAAARVSSSCDCLETTGSLR
jgi:glycosyltransferase involved in cell wall biosynthesis